MRSPTDACDTRSRDEARMLGAVADHDITSSRQDYALGSLRAEDLGGDPIVAFDSWMQSAVEAAVPEPNAASLATVDDRGQPSSRIVLCRGYDARGFTFYTNYEGRKARELDGQQRAALCFFWQPLERQVRIEGKVERVSAAESDAYFASRPRASRIGAWASPQSRVLSSRDELEALYAETVARFDGVEDVPRPEGWGGYRVVHERVEFWQGRPSRLHDRILFERENEGDGWSTSRLAP